MAAVSLVRQPQEAELVIEDVDLSAMSLTELAARANSEHAETQRVMTWVVDHGVNVGLALLEVKSRHVGRSTWTRWMDENLTFARPIGQLYMRMAVYENELRDAGVVGGQKQIRRVLSGLPPLPRTTDTRTLDESLEKEARQLVADGTPKAEAARLLDVSTDTIYRWTSPDYSKKRVAARQRLRRKAQAAERALLEKEKADAIKKAGGNISAAYGHVRKAAAELDAALSDATSPEVRTALRAALAGVHKAEDEIGKAVRSQ